MSKEISNEYDMLRAEIMHLMSLHNTLVTFTITTVVALLAIVATQKNAYLFLLPFGVIIPMSMRLAYYRRALAKISAYMIVFLESAPDNIKWETRNLSFAAFDENRPGKKYALRYYECLILSGLCYILYFTQYCSQITHFQAWTWLHLLDLIWPLLLVAIEWKITKKMNRVDKDRLELIGVWHDIKQAGDKLYERFLEPRTAKNKLSNPITRRGSCAKEEYEMVRAEAQNGIDRQDNYNNLVFTLLSVSTVISTVYENAAFILLVLYASAILLAYVLHYRNVVNYTTSYLFELEKTAQSGGIMWEHSIHDFRAYLNGPKPEWKWYDKATLQIIQFARKFRNFGNLILTVFLFIRLGLIIYPEMLTTYESTGHYLTLPLGCICVLAIIAGILNLIFTLSFYFDHSLKKAYSATWEKLLTHLSQKSPNSIPVTDSNGASDTGELIHQ